MNIAILILTALSWLRLLAQAYWPPARATANGGLVWRWNLGVKEDSYGYSVVVRRLGADRYAVLLERSQGQPRELIQLPKLSDAIKVGDALRRTYRDTTHIRCAYDPEELGECGI